VLGPLHGYGIARRIEQISGDLLFVNQGTLYPVLLRLEHEGGACEPVREQPPGAFLSTHPSGTQVVGGGKAGLGPDSGHHRAVL
jgi:hypothetical protein